jgi:hypothetical protein
MKTFSLQPSNWNIETLQCGAFIRAAKRSAGIRDSGRALDQSPGSLDLEELKQAASNGEAGLVRRTAPAGIQRLSECCTRQGLELEQWRCDTVGFGNSRA